jgi:hypothetical protein
MMASFPRAGTSAVIDSLTHSSQTQAVLVLLVCSDEERLNRLKDAIHSAGFHTISTRGLDAAWTRTDFFDFGAVVIDHELKNDVAVSAFQKRFITLNLREDAPPESVGLELTNLFNRGSALVH